MVTLNRSLTYRRHLESLRKKLTSRVALLRRLAGSVWGAGATTLQITTVALVHSTAEYCAPVWCRSPHSRLIDPAINDALQIVIGRLRSAPTDNPSFVAKELHFLSTTPCHGAWTSTPLSAHMLTEGECTALQIEHPFAFTAQLISSSDNNNVSAAYCVITN